MTAARERGFLLVIEGIDGTGKSTTARALADALRAAGDTVVLSREPTDGPFGRRIRELAREGRDSVSPAQEAELFENDRREHARDVIAPALDAGRTVVLDRYYFSTAAYQGARGLDPATILARNEAFAPRPDLLVMVRLDTDQAIGRIRRSRPEGADHFEGREYLHRVAAAFDAMTFEPCLKLDGSLPTDEQVERIITRMNEAGRGADAASGRKE